MGTISCVLSKFCNRASPNQQSKERRLFVGCVQFFLLWINAVKRLKLPSDNTAHLQSFLSVSAANQQTMSSSPTFCLTSSVYYIKTDEQVNEFSAETAQIVTAGCVGTWEKSNGQGPNSLYQLKLKGFRNCSDCFMSDGRRSQWFFFVTR